MYKVKITTLIYIYSLMFSSVAMSQIEKCFDLFKNQKSVHYDWQKLGFQSDRLREGHLVGASFLAPNEKHIGLNTALFTRMPNRGMYVSVGTERGLLSMSLVPKNEMILVQVDRDPQVVLFNLINKALLEMSRNRKDYLFLRLNAQFKDIVIYLKNHEHDLSSESLNVILNQKNWSWWAQQVQSNKAWSEFHDQTGSNPLVSFGRSHYLYHDDAFAVVSALAKANRIVVLHADLASFEFETQLRQVAQHEKSKIAVVDLSNSWQQGYVGHQNTVDLLSRIQDLYQLGSQVVLTYQDRDSEVNNLTTLFKYMSIGLDSRSDLKQISFVFSELMRKENRRSQNSYNPRYNRFDRD